MAYTAGTIGSSVTGVLGSGVTGGSGLDAVSGGIVLQIVFYSPCKTPIKTMRVAATIYR